MKKKGIFFAFLLLLILSAFFVRAAANQTDTQGYTCLQNLVSSRGCSSLSTEEKIFSLLAINSCKTEVLDDSYSNQCWPDSGCSIKTTAQAILALHSVNADVTTAKQWLISQNLSSPDLNWFLQVDSQNATTCTITSPQDSSTLTVNEDKTLSGNLGGCLQIYHSYWLQINPNCYGEPFHILCQDNFLTSLLYQKKNSATVYVSQKTHSEPGAGTTTEEVASSCFGTGNSCDYEGTLWAAMVLKSLNYDVSSYIPYLTAMADDNEKYLPESFLYYLTNDFRTELLAGQHSSQWWSVSGDKFYDTAVALLPFQNQQLPEKTNSINWLSQVQDSDGCWQGDNVRDTAFVLYSIWPKAVATPTAQDCAASGYHCITSAECSAAGGNVLQNYTGCFTDICCDKPQIVESCSQMSGQICGSGQICSSSTVSASDTNYCCTGTCQTQQAQTYTCESNGGSCRGSCLDGETESYDYSCSSGYCCIQKTSSINILLIVILSILIILVLLGIIFRKKIQIFFSNMKSGKGKPPARPMGPRPMGPPPPRFPPSSQTLYPGAVPRRIFPPQQMVPMRRPIPQNSQNKEVDEVLKKLKEIGKEEPNTPPKAETLVGGTKQVNVRAHTRRVNTKK